MRLPPSEVERFYRIWLALILFVNRRLGLVPGMLSMTGDSPSGLDVNNVRKIRDALWADDALREAFVADNPAGLGEADLEIVRSWRHREAGNFFVLRHLKKHSLFLAEKGQTVYAVLGLNSPLEDVVPFVPSLVRAVLLPWEGRIIYDSLIEPYNISFGGGIRQSLNENYLDAKERGAIVTSLPPPQPPADSEESRAAARATSERVLEAFRKDLFAAGLSPRVVERDVAQATDFAMHFLATLPGPRSLRDFGPAEAGEYLSRHTAALTSMKRLVRFLRDTGRIDYDRAEEIKGRLLKGKA